MTGDGWEPDPLILDDQNLIVDVAGKGLVVVSGCSRAGAVNVLHNARRLTGRDRIVGFVGGFHLTGAVFEPLLEPTVAAFAEFGVERLVPGHCTGWKGTHRLAQAMPDAFVQPSVGTTLQFLTRSDRLPPGGQDQDQRPGPADDQRGQQRAELHRGLEAAVGEGQVGHEQRHGEADPGHRGHPGQLGGQVVPSRQAASPRRTASQAAAVMPASFPTTRPASTPPSTAPPGPASTPGSSEIPALASANSSTTTNALTGCRSWAKHGQRHRPPGLPQHLAQARRPRGRRPASRPGAAHVQATSGPGGRPGRGRAGPWPPRPGPG